MYKCRYFGIQELVSRAAYNMFGELCWQFFQEDILKDLDIAREAWELYVRSKYPKEKVGIIINNWSFGGSYNESGLRTNIDSLVKSKKTVYLSAHVLACGFDLKPTNGRHEEFHTLMCNLIKQKKFKKFRRVENRKSAPTWCHLDAFRTPNDELIIF